MKKMTYLLYLVGTIQITLGVFHLFLPELFLKSTGHSIPQADIADSAFPMFNATWIIVLLFLWMPKQSSKA